MSLNYQQTLDFLYTQLPMYQQQGASALNYKLDKILRFCEALGHPEKAFKAVHVAGTNGKGSTSHMLAAVLQRAGVKTGLYTSPHLKNFTERIKVNGSEISEEAVINFVENHKALIKELKPSFFEMTVAMAFEHFRDEEVEVAVVEVGLGGRFDSTNIIKPLVSVITNIGLDHQALLGNTLAEIAFEKAGIIKQDTPVVIGEFHPETFPVFEEQAKKLNAPLIKAFDPVETGHRPVSPHIPDYQKKNQRTALAAIEQLRNHYVLPEEIVDQALENFREITGFTGRWQKLSEKPLTYCDTGHNEDGVKAVINEIQKLQWEKLHIVLGMVNDKDISKVLSLFPKEANYYFCNANMPRALAAAELAQKAESLGLKGKVVPDVKEALKAAQAEAQANDLVFVGGSTFVVAEVL